MKQNSLTFLQRLNALEKDNELMETKIKLLESAIIKLVEKLEAKEGIK